MARRSDGLPALDRVVRVLDAFRADAPVLTLAEIGAHTGLPGSTVHRVVHDLVAYGLLERVPERRYRIGARLWEMGSRSPGVLGLHETARPFLNRVQSAVRQHTQLLVRMDLDALVVDRLSARDAVVNASIVGGRLPLQHSSSGLVLLAAAGLDVVEAVVARGLAPRTPAGIATAHDLRSALAQVRRLGFADAPGFIWAESRGIAVPIHGADDVVVGALGVVVANDGQPADGYVAILRRAADGITTELLRSYLPPDHPAARKGGAFRQLVNSSEPSMERLESLT